MKLTIKLDILKATTHSDVLHLGLPESGVHNTHPQVLLLTLTVEQECLRGQVQLLEPGEGRVSTQRVSGEGVLTIQCTERSEEALLLKYTVIGQCT